MSNTMRTLTINGRTYTFPDGIYVIGAAVGQIVKISAVDENGVPTEWEPADMSTGNADESDIINKITDPKHYPLSSGGVDAVNIPMEVGGISRSTGELAERNDAVRPIDFIRVSGGETIYFTTSHSESFNLCLMGYDADKNYIEYMYSDTGAEFTVPASWAYCKFYESDTSDTSIAFGIERRAESKKAEFKNIFMSGHGYEIYGDEIDDETMHKIVIYAQGKDGNEYNITEIKAPEDDPAEATLALMNSGRGTVQFVDLSSMRYGHDEQGSFSIVMQSRGNTPLPQYRLQFNCGDSQGRVSRMTVDPDAIPVCFTSRGMKVRRSNVYNPDWTDEETVTIDLVSMFEKVNVMHDALAASGAIVTESPTVSDGYIPCIEYGALTNGFDTVFAEVPYVRTRDYIGCYENQSYSFTVENEWTLYFYDADKTVLENHTVTNETSVISPTSAAYMRLVCESNYLAEALRITGSVIGKTYELPGDLRDTMEQHISEEVVSAVASRSQLKPEFASSISECSDTSKLYVLPDGYIYAYMSGSTQETFTDVLADVGYQEGYRINSSGGIVAWYTPETRPENYADTTNYIPCKTGDIIRVKNMPIPATYDSGYYWNQVAAYDSGKAYLTKSALGTSESGIGGNLLDAVTEGDYVVQFTIKESIFGANVAYIAIGAQDITSESEVYVNSTLVTADAFVNTNHAFVPADYETRINDLEDEVSSLGGSLIPSYWLTELATKAETIRTAMETAGPNKSAFLWYTDAHWQTNSKVSPVLLRYLQKNTPINKINFGGDVVNDPSSFTHENIKYVYDWRSMIADLRNHHSVPGNHDLNHNSTDVRNMAYAFLIASEESPDMVRGDGLYYYIDNNAERTRYLYLDYMTSDVTAILAQSAFIADALNTTPTDWHIVAIAHRWFQYTSSSEPTVGVIPGYEQDILQVFDEYNARSTHTASNYFTSYDFSNGKGKVEFCIGGHIHVDHNFTSDGGIPVIITASDTNQERSSSETEDSGTLGTITEAAVFGIIADYNSNTITVVGVGRGGSRTITY